MWVDFQQETTKANRTYKVKIVNTKGDERIGYADWNGETLLHNGDLEPKEFIKYFYNET